MTTDSSLRSAPRPVLVAAAALLLAFALGGCGDDDLGGRAVEIIDDVTYADGLTMSVHVPTGEGPWPSVVLIHGAGLDRAEYRSFADALAARGTVVFNANWDVLSPTLATALGQIGCAVRYARVNAERFGADQGDLVLVGHSVAAAYVGFVALAGDDLEAPCRVDPDLLPDGLVLLAPATLPGGTTPFPYSVLGRNPELRIVMAHGADDDVASPGISERLVQIWEEADYDVRMLTVSGGHYDLVAVGEEVVDTEAVQAVLSLIMALLESPPR